MELLDQVAEEDNDISPRSLHSSVDLDSICDEEWDKLEKCNVI